MKTVTYNKTKLEYKSTHRALRDYALIKGSDRVDNYADTLQLMYCIVKAQAKIAGIKFDLDLDAFVDWLDMNPDALEGFTADEEVAEVKGDGKKEDKGKKS